jgi:hypothetical protein
MAEATFPEMTPKAAEAFALYVGMGPKRSLEGLCKCLQSATEPPPTRRLETLKDWSVRYGWQARLSSAVTALAESRLEQAAEIDARSFLRTSELIEERLDYTSPLQLDAIIKARETVRKPSAKSSSVTITIEIRQRAEQIAKKYGVPVEDVIAEAEAVAAGAWDSWSPNS